jgi:peptide chain release factor 1
MRELIASYTKKDFEVETFCTGGPGGQNQNKRQMGVRIRHIPTGLVAESRESRYQAENKSKAFRKLAELVKKYHQNLLRQEKFRSNEVIRTYHEQDNRVTDHSSGLKQSYTEVEKDISEMIEARTKSMQ